MADSKVTLYHPGGTQVEVTEARAETLRSRGYTDSPTTAGDDTPNVSDKKQAWIDYAVTQGLDEDEASSLTKDELVERFGG